MSLKGLLAALGEYRVFRDHLQEIGNPTRPARITVRQGARPAYLAALWHHRQLPMLVLTPRPEDSRRLYDQLLTYLGDAGPLCRLLPRRAPAGRRDRPGPPHWLLPRWLLRCGALFLLWL